LSSRPLVFQTLLGLGTTRDATTYETIAGAKEIDILNRVVRAGDSVVHLSGIEQSLLYTIGRTVPRRHCRRRTRSRSRAGETFRLSQPSAVSRQPAGRSIR
jgi:hypothetical protein